MTTLLEGIAAWNRDRQGRDSTGLQQLRQSIMINVSALPERGAPFGQG